MKIIHQYSVHGNNSEQPIRVPNGKIIHFGITASGFKIWIEFNNSLHTFVTMIFKIFCANEEIPDNFIYIASVVDEYQAYHLYRKEK